MSRCIGCIHECTHVVCVSVYIYKCVSARLYKCISPCVSVCMYNFTFEKNQMVRNRSDDIFKGQSTIVYHFKAMEHGQMEPKNEAD